MAEAYIVDAVRSPVGRRGGGLSQVHPADLGAHSLRAARYLATSSNSPSWPFQKKDSRGTKASGESPAAIAAST